MKIEEVPNRIKEILKKYIEELEKNHYHIQQTILFGSYSKGTYDEWSDIDIALVSENFGSNDILNRRMMRKITHSVDTDLSPFTFRPEEFTLDNLFIKEIISSGIRIV
jgi:predicted nucleotidyltransferase